MHLFKAVDEVDGFRCRGCAGRRFPSEECRRMTVRAAGTATGQGRRLQNVNPTGRDAIDQESMRKIHIDKTDRLVSTDNCTRPVGG